MTNQHLIPDTSVQKDLLSRLKLYVEWLDANDRYWFDTSVLDAYHTYLKQERGFAESTVKAYIATVRGRYRQLIKDGTLSKALETLFAGEDAPTLAAKARVGELLHMIDLSRPSLKEPKVSKRHRHLTEEHVNALLEQPQSDERVGLRDKTIIGLLAATGVRERELVGLDVADVAHELNGEPVLRVNAGTDDERLIPYGYNQAVLNLVRDWIKSAYLERGPLFHGFYKGGHTRREGRLSPRAVQNILANYPIQVDGETITVNPLDLRHAYARFLYLHGTPLETIQQRLGLKTAAAVMGYIDWVDPGKTSGYLVYHFHYP